MEAELNSRLMRLAPGETYYFDTEWLPTRADANFQGVADAGVILKPLHAAQDANGKVTITGSFGVFFAGKLVAHLYNTYGTAIAMQALLQVDPRNPISLRIAIADPGRTHRISLHLVDANGLDRGTLGETALDSSTGSE